MVASGWSEEWRALRIRCRPSFGAVRDESALFERLQDVGAWHFENGDSLIVCVDRVDADRRRDAVLAALRRQGVEPTIDAEGRGFARRDGVRLKAYRIEIGDTVHEMTLPAMRGTIGRLWRAWTSRDGGEQ
jgi:hypothetical protein